MSASTLDGAWLDCPYCGKAAVDTVESWLAGSVSRLIVCGHCGREVPVRCVHVLVVDTSVTRKAVGR